MKQEFADFNEFYKYYMEAHKHPVSLALHFFGTSLFFISIGAALISQNWYLIPAAIVTGYLMAWTGHFVFEKNKPATFGYPAWSARAARVMYVEILTGKLKILGQKK
jgi:hypothetical protein